MRKERVTVRKKGMMISKIRVAFYMLFSLFLGVCLGCTTIPAVTPPISSAPGPGVYHQVQKGETLWRISKIYNVDLDELVTINHISDATKIEVDQRLLIPLRNKKVTPGHYAKENEDFIWPIKGRVMVNFNQTFQHMLNKGINIQPFSVNDVLAARSGRVIFASQNFKRYGKTIIIDHLDGYITVYAHASQLLAKSGDFLHQGEAIAKIGSAENNTNIYLHFEIRKGHLPKNPLFYLP